MTLTSIRKPTTLIAGICLFAAILLVSVLPTGKAGAHEQISEYRAGNAAFTPGQAGIYVTFSKAMHSTDYAVVVQPTNTAGYSPTKNCTYFNVLKKNTTNFQVQHKECESGRPIALDTSVSLNWIAQSYN